MAVGITAQTRTSLPAIKLVQSSTAGVAAGHFTADTLGDGYFAMLFVPWQQSAKGRERSSPTCRKSVNKRLLHR